MEAQPIEVPRPRPFIPKGSHPIETGRYLLATNEIIRLHQTVSRWIENRAPGGIIYGRPRLGKTRAINYLMHDLPSEFGKQMPIFHMCCRQYKNPNESSFFEDILKDIGHALPSTGKANQKRDRVLRFLLECGEASGQHRIVLFIDDAQRLFEIQYGWLMDIYNELDRAGISLTVILVGQTELIHQRSAFLQAKKAQIIGRFMVHEYKFTGIKSIHDIRACLIGYDSISEFPQDSGWSFVRYFFPEAFETGFRLENCAEDILHAFAALRQEEGLLKAIEIPMQYFTLTVEYVLRRFGVNGDFTSSITVNHWKEAILNSGYIQAEIFQDVVV
jgi:hypothetical protein